jgi:membrane-bound lytic murein transglycosylase B
MDEVNRRRPAGLRVVLGAVTLTLAACLLSSCNQDTSADERTRETAAQESLTAPGNATGRSPSPAPQSIPDEVLGGLPAVPDAGNALALARQLELAAATLRDREAVAGDVRRAGEFQQLAVRTLATASDTFRRKVMSRLRPQTVVVVRGAVRAARLLHAMTSPQRRLPRWHIVAPPPARDLLGYYRAAQRRTGVPWTYLAAIHLVETRMGRIRGASTAGARGPMQFLPSTWDLYGAGGDINDPRDAILAAARLLRANGAPGDMGEALRHYNQSNEYVRAVSAYARTMTRSRSAYRGYWHWRVLYRHVRGTYVLPVGYPKVRPVLLRAG